MPDLRHYEHGACFNPHPHAEGDKYVPVSCGRCIVSIHTLTRRVTMKKVKLPKIVMVSIHTLTRRVTNLAKKVYEMLNSFNPHPHAEGDLFPRAAI